PSPTLVVLSTDPHFNTRVVKNIPDPVGPPAPTGKDVQRAPVIRHSEPYLYGVRVARPPTCGRQVAELFTCQPLNLVQSAINYTQSYNSGQSICLTVVTSPASSLRSSPRSVLMTSAPSGSTL